MPRKKTAPADPPKRGRPEWQPDRDLVENLAALGCTHDEMASVLKVDEKTLVKHCSEEIKMGRAKRRVSLRRSLDKWVDRHVGAAIFLAKNELGMSDVGTTKLVGPDGGPIQVQQQSALYIVELPSNGRYDLDHGPAGRQQGQQQGQQALGAGAPVRTIPPPAED